MPPWLEAFLNQSSQQNKGPYAQQVSPVATAANPTGVGTGGTTAPTPAPVQGSDMLDIFTKALASHLASNDALAPRRQQMAEDLTFGRHLGMSGQPITAADPNGEGGNWNKFFGGNATSNAAVAERARPLGTNYGPVSPGVQTTETLPPLSNQDMRATELKYAPRVKDPNYKFGVPVPPPHQSPFRTPATF